MMIIKVLFTSHMLKDKLVITDTAMAAQVGQLSEMFCCNKVQKFRKYLSIKGFSYTLKSSQPVYLTLAHSNLPYGRAASD